MLRCYLTGYILTSRTTARLISADLFSSQHAADDMKTERRSYVSCLNCREDTAAAQFIETKRLRGKLGGRVCYHGYQSFKADEVTAETAHEIGVKLAQELWGDRFEVVVATHCNTGHYHNHFVINSVSCVDGYKFYNSPADYAHMREVSDRLCREYAISVIENPGGRAKHYAEWQAEQNGKPTHRGTIRADIDRAIRASTTERDFLRVMGEMGYVHPLKLAGPPDGGLHRPHQGLRLAGCLQRGHSLRGQRNAGLRGQSDVSVRRCERYYGYHAGDQGLGGLETRPYRRLHWERLCGQGHGYQVWCGQDGTGGPGLAGLV